MENGESARRPSPNFFPTHGTHGTRRWLRFWTRQVGGVHLNPMPRCGSLVWLGLAAVAGIMGLRKLHRALAQLDPPPTCPCSRVLHGGCYGGGSCSAGGPPLGDDVEVVIAHCKHSLDFLGDLRGDIVSAGLHLKLIIIVAKCGETAALRALRNTASHELWGVLNVVPQSNVGRCDHSWATHIARNYHTLASRLIMIKDSWADHNLFERLNGSALVAATTSDFACAYGNLRCKQWNFSCKDGNEHLWHSAAELLSFRISNYQKPWDQSNHSITSDFPARHRPLGNWMLSLQLPSHVETQRYLPVCYGGGFVAARSAVHRVPEIAWRRIVESLSRGDNVEESHYMERMWAALLTPPLTPSETRAMACVAKTADREMLPYLTGSVNNCLCGDVERCGAGLDGSKGRHMASANHSALHSMPEGEVEVEEDWADPLAHTNLGPRKVRSGKRVAIFMQVASDSRQIVDELCQCIANVAAVPARKLDVHISLAGKGRSEPAVLERLRMRLATDLAQKRAAVRILRVANAGADVGQFLKQMRRSSARHDEYDLILKIHSKTSSAWRERSLQALCGTPEQVQALYAAFERDPSLGVVAPQGTVFHKNTPLEGVWVHIRQRYFKNLPLASAFDDNTVNLMHKIDALLFPNDPPFRHPVIAAGTQFWMRSGALRPFDWGRLVDMSNSVDHDSPLRFTSEYQPNLKLEHAVERLLVSRALADGWSIADVFPAPRPVAFYFPQYHPIPENDRFWGKNFTEWTLLKPSTLPRLRKPLPVESGGLGYYNALDKETRRKQAALARQAGLYGFCFYHYWFGGLGKVMHRVPEARLLDGEPNIPFMLSWANEPWTRRWDGTSKGGGILLNQSYGDHDDWQRHFDYLLPFWEHPMHIRIDGRPLFAIYRVGHFKSETLIRMLKTWRRLAALRGVPPPLVVHTLGNFYLQDHTPQMLRGGVGQLLEGALHFWPQLLGSGFFDWTSAASTSDVAIGNKLQFWGAYLGFDRRVRSPSAAPMALTPSQVALALKYCFGNMSWFARPNQNLLFITAWNEWNEQAVLEPDTTYADGMSRALRHALRNVPVRVVIPSVSKPKPS